MKETNENEIVILGTSQAISQATTRSDFSAIAVTRCYVIPSVTNIGEEEIEEFKYYTESIPVTNPRTGTFYDFQDPTRWTTAFEKDKTYNDIPRSYQTQTAFAEFETTFSNTTLSGNQLAVASTAFHLDQLGYRVHILILPSEADLLHFTLDRGWSYKVVGS